MFVVFLKKFIFFFCLSVLFFSEVSALWAIDKVDDLKELQPSAMTMFLTLPSTIFENTLEGMGEGEKDTLNIRGESDFWLISQESEEELILTSKMPFSDTKVIIKLFRANNGDTYIVEGQSSGEGCIVELWKRDTLGRIIPIAIPEEPRIEEFFDKNQNQGKGMEVSMLICLSADYSKLEAKPLIWTSKGLIHLDFENHVYYEWSGKKFIKKIEKIEDD